MNANESKAMAALKEIVRQVGDRRLGMFPHLKALAETAISALESQPVAGQDWNEKRRQVNAIILELQGKPESEKMGYAVSPGGFLNAYREGDLTFSEAVAAIEKWAQEQNLVSGHVIQLSSDLQGIEPMTGESRLRSMFRQNVMLALSEASDENAKSVGWEATEEDPFQPDLSVYEWNMISEWAADKIVAALLAHCQGGQQCEPIRRK